MHSAEYMRGYNAAMREVALGKDGQRQGCTCGSCRGLGGPCSRKPATLEFSLWKRLR